MIMGQKETLHYFQLHYIKLYYISKILNNKNVFFS